MKLAAYLLFIMSTFGMFAEAVKSARSQGSLSHPLFSETSVSRDTKDSIVSDLPPLPPLPPDAVAPHSAPLMASGDYGRQLDGISNLMFSTAVIQTPPPPSLLEQAVSPWQGSPPAMPVSVPIPDRDGSLVSATGNIAHHNQHRDMASTLSVESPMQQVKLAAMHVRTSFTRQAQTQHQHVRAVEQLVKTPAPQRPVEFLASHATLARRGKPSSQFLQKDALQGQHQLLASTEQRPLSQLQLDYAKRLSEYQQQQQEFANWAAQYKAYYATYGKQEETYEVYQRNFKEQQAHQRHIRSLVQTGVSTQHSQALASRDRALVAREQAVMVRENDVAQYRRTAALRQETLNRRLAALRSEEVEQQHEQLQLDAQSSELWKEQQQVQNMQDRVVQQQQQLWAALRQRQLQLRMDHTHSPQVLEEYQARFPSSQPTTVHAQFPARFQAQVARTQLKQMQAPTEGASLVQTTTHDIFEMHAMHAAVESADNEDTIEAVANNEDARSDAVVQSRQNGNEDSQVTVSEQRDSAGRHADNDDLKQLSHR